MSNLPDRVPQGHPFTSSVGKDMRLEVGWEGLFREEVVAGRNLLAENGVTE